MLIAIAVAGSCSKVDVSKSIAGTTWTASSNDDDWKLDVTIQFSTETYTVTTNSDIPDGNGKREKDVTTNHGTYVYDSPTVVLYTSSGYLIYGTVNGNTMSLKQSPGWASGPTQYKLK